MKKNKNDIKYKYYNIKIVLSYVTIILNCLVIILSILSLMNKVSFIYPLLIFVINYFLISYKKNIDRKNKE